MPNPITPEQLARSGSEDGHQAALFCWAASYDRSVLKRLFAIPNGGSRHQAEALKLMATGVKRGVPDICLPVAIYPYHGLYIELKRPASAGKAAGRSSEEQNDWADFLRAQGYMCRLCYGWEQARDTILEYIK
jgi:VRR-NUC domain